MKYDINRIEFAKTQKTKYVIQTSKHIFQIGVDLIVYDDMFSKHFKHFEMFYLLWCFTFAGLRCFCVSLTPEHTC